MGRKVSVIVPVYNVEKYLKKCVESIVNQTYQDLEIILIDDGSIDYSGQICDEFSKYDSRVITIHKENGGASEARNEGIECATGDYLCFVDSDDWLDTQMIQVLVNNIEQNNAEIAFCGNTNFKETNGHLYKIATTNRAENSVVMLEQHDAVKWVYSRPFVLWGGIYKKHIFADVRMPVGVIGEDEAVVMDIMDKCQIMCYTTRALYNYRLRTDNLSVTTSGFSEKYFNWIGHCKKNLDYVSKKFPDLRYFPEKKYYQGIIWCLNGATSNPRKYKDSINEAQNLLKTVESRQFCKKNLSRKERFRIWLLLNCYGLYALVVRLMKKDYM